MKRVTSLYRMFNKDGELLYVGISADFSRRLGQHADDKDWWSEVDAVSVEHFATRGAALMAERNAIVNEKPAWNIAMNQPRAKPFTPLALAVAAEVEAQTRPADERKPLTEPRICHVCGTGILGRPSSTRIDNRIRIVHLACREPQPKPVDDRALARQERKEAILRGEIL